MAMTNRRYQGYPYVDPPVTDVTSISADDAARWQHLPRRQVDLPVKRNTPTDAPDCSRAPLPFKNESNATPVVYIDLPETSSSIVAQQCSEDRDFEVIESPNSSTNDKKDLDVPVVYIDLPSVSGSDVATSWENTSQEEEEPTFVQDTIFYDPFENRRIDRSKPARDESDDESDISSPRSAFRMPARRPNHIDINEAGTSAGPSSYSSPPGVSSLMTKEADIYGQDDRFPTSPIPVSQFPQPPPAYAEIDALSSPVVEQEPVVEQPRPASPPKTQVILPQDNNPSTMPIGMPNPNRKYLNCHHCGMRVHTLVIKETGMVTHVAALTCCMIACLPAIFFIYCTDFLKVKNHYCPNCNKSIGYEQPMSSNKIFYVN